MRFLCDQAFQQANILLKKISNFKNWKKSGIWTLVIKPKNSSREMKKFQYLLLATRYKTVKISPLKFHEYSTRISKYVLKVIPFTLNDIFLENMNFNKKTFQRIVQ
mmetsp:Transcript_9510/g.8374  ORF Transcript_9510/g.8374 Transcript_9510/m.8374 type:complete len:106 (-) Transcript_9510:243-560(-)